MKYIPGEKYRAEIEQGHAVPDIDYPIPTPEQNFYNLHRSFTKAYLRERRIEKKQEDEYYATNNEVQR